MNTSKLTIIGGGNLGASIAAGLIASQKYSPSQITVTRRNKNMLANLSSQGVNVTSDNREAVKGAKTIILAVKPKQYKAVLQEISPALDHANQRLISVITGVSLADLRNEVGGEIKLFRAMPNTAIAIRQSMTCIATQHTSAEDTEAVVAIFDLLGKTVIIDENLMAAATVLGACGIAYALRFIRAASQGGIEIGFNADIAQLIAAQTVKGAASLLLELGQHPEREIDKVTTPQGCTIVGLNEMEHQGFSSSLIKGIGASYSKIAYIAEEAKGS